MFTIVLTWKALPWIGLVLLVLSVVAFFSGTLPDNDYKPKGDAMRWVVWPLFIVWVVVVFIRGLFFAS